MSKMRIHELAKQIEKDSKDIIKVLTNNGVEVKNHMSTITAEDIEKVKKVLLNPQKEEQPKKSRITQVYNPQYSGVNKKYNNKNNNTQKSNMDNNTTTTKNITQTNAKENQLQSNNRPVNNNRPYHNNTNNGLNNKPYNNNSNYSGANNRNTTTTTNSNYSGANNRNVTTTTNSNYSGTNNRNTTATTNQNTNHTTTTNHHHNNNNTSNNRYSNNNGSSNANAKPFHNNNTGNNTNARPYNNNSNNTNNRQTNNRNTSNNQASGQNTNASNNNNKPQGNRPQNTNRVVNNNNFNNSTNNKPQANKEYSKQKENNDFKQNKGGNRPNQQKPQNKQFQRPQQPIVQKPKEEVIKVITLPEILTIKDLADKLKMPASALVKKLFLQGKIVTINQEIDFDTAEEIALEFEIIAEKEVKVDVIEELLKEDDEEEALLKARPPVVCVMGHVDHGKTSLLDAIRETNVISREAGGITQHIGAYVVEINGQKITFLDTPGHEAFTAMRMRGAQSTDIAILVVAADDGVMPQTVEAINHAKAAGISIIVAINKIDKPSANIDRVKQELSEYELIPEDWGGDTIFVPVSAHTKEGIESLLEMVLLTAEICELKANPNRNARGIVIEAQLDKGKGSVATVLVQKGTLRVGDHIAAGSSYGKVRAMMDDKGRRLKTAGPSTPVEILGLNSVPNAGEIFVATENDKEARHFAETFISEGKERLIEGTKAKMSLDDLFTQIQAGDVKELNIIVKADVQGSVEAVKQSLIKLSNENVVVKIIHGGVGAINESDVILASASNTIIIGFNVRPDNTAKEIADREKVDLRLYRVIYNAIEDVEAAMKGMLDPVFREKVLGHAEVRQTFKASGIGTIAGSYVLDGIFKRDCSIRLTRDNVVIYEGPLASLKRFKDDVKEVKAGYECGFVFEKFNDIKEGDLVESYEMEEIPR